MKFIFAVTNLSVDKRQNLNYNSKFDGDDDI